MREAARQFLPPLRGSRYIPSTKNEIKLAKQLRNKSVGRLIQYGGLAAWFASGAAVTTGVLAGIATHNWDPVVQGVEAGVALYCGGPLVAGVGWAYKELESVKAHATAKKITTGDPLAQWVRTHGGISGASTAVSILNTATFLGAVVVPPPFDVLLGAAHVGGRIVHAAKYTHSFAIEKEAWGQLRRRRRALRARR